MLGRNLVFVYGIVSYLVFLASFVYAIGFVGNIIAPKSIDNGGAQPVGTAVLVNLILLGLFAVQHSGMARPSFKKRWSRILPRPLERSTYVLLSSLLLFLLFWQWRPLPAMVWNISNPAAAAAIHALFWVGWLIVLCSTFMIDHFDLFGLKQTYCYWRGKEYVPPAFKEVWLYRYVRHPIMVGFVVAFWATPTMTVGHLLFAVVTTIYILLGIRLEERDLLGIHGEQYQAYRRKTSMLFPWPSSGA